MSQAPLCCTALALPTVPPISSEGPFDPAVVALQAGDALADALLEEGLPGHELEAEPILDHCEASADEAGDAGKAAADGSGSDRNVDLPSLAVASPMSTRRSRAVSSRSSQVAPSLPICL